MAFLSEEDGDTTTLKAPEDVTDDDIRSFLAELDKVAEAHEISEEEFHVDIGEEVKHIVDEALSGETAHEPDEDVEVEPLEPAATGTGDDGPGL